jgi:hypothetical protein
MHSITVAQDRDRWRALVNTVMHFGFHKVVSSGVSVQREVRQEGLCCMKLVS